jgi:PAS domain S-box-containing protein
MPCLARFYRRPRIISQWYGPNWGVSPVGATIAPYEARRLAVRRLPRYDARMQRVSRFRRDDLLVTLAATLALAIFAVDLQLPLGISTGMLYVVVILFGLRITIPIYPVAAAAVCTVLLIVDVIAGWTADAPAAAYLNPPLMALVYWITAVLVLRFGHLERHSENQMKQLADLKYALDQAAIVATTDVSGRITYVNNKFCEISKYSREELLGQDHRIINSGLHSKEFFRDLWRTIAQGRVWHAEIRNRAKDGTFYWVDTTIVPFLNQSGHPYQYTAIRADITQRKLVEERLREQASLARVGQMAAVVAHEVKNPLAGIKGAMQVLMTRRIAADPEVAVMRDIITRIDALNELIQDLLLFARPRPPRLEPVPLAAVLRDAADVLHRDPAGASVRVNVPPIEITVIGDTQLIKAMFVNLLLNAAQAMHGTGAIDVTATRDGIHCRIDVRDHGPGIPEAIRQEIFEPFFTTKSRGGGLGLAIARRTVELHGGTLTFSCPADGGTLMRVVLPLRPPVTIEPEPATEAAPVR